MSAYTPKQVEGTKLGLRTTSKVWAVYKGGKLFRKKGIHYQWATSKAKIQEKIQTLEKADAGAGKAKTSKKAPSKKAPAGLSVSACRDFLLAQGYSVSKKKSSRKSSEEEEVDMSYVEFAERENPRRKKRRRRRRK